MFGTDVVLRRENEKQLAEVREDDRKAIRAIMKSMSIFRVNSYEAQVIHRDLIGMAHELRLRGSSLHEAAGHDIKAFANEIIHNSGGPCQIEIVLGFLGKLSGYLLAWFAGLSLVAYGGLSWDANPSLFIYYVGTVILLFVAEGLITPFFITERGHKRLIPSALTLVLLVGFTATIYPLGQHPYAWSINSGVVIVVSGLAYLLTQYLKMQNSRRLAKG